MDVLQDIQDGALRALYYAGTMDPRVWRRDPAGQYQYDVLTRTPTEAAEQLRDPGQRASFTGRAVGNLPFLMGAMGVAGMPWPEEPLPPGEAVRPASKIELAIGSISQRNQDLAHDLRSWMMPRYTAGAAARRAESLAKQAAERSREDIKRRAVELMAGARDAWQPIKQEWHVPERVPPPPARGGDMVAFGGPGTPVLRDYVEGTLPDIQRYRSQAPVAGVAPARLVNRQPPVVPERFPSPNVYPRMGQRGSPIPGWVREQLHRLAFRPSVGETLSRIEQQALDSLLDDLRLPPW